MMSGALIPALSRGDESALGGQALARAYAACFKRSWDSGAQKQTYSMSLIDNLRHHRAGNSTTIC
jgi:organic hydroperoxide reductase OsmC/OhrA